MRMVELRRLIWKRLADEASAMSENGTHIQDLPEGSRSDADLRRADLAAQQVAALCEKKAEGG